MVALFFILSGFATPPNESLAEVVNNLHLESKRLSLVLAKQNNSLAEEAQLLFEKISTINTNLNKMPRTNLTQTEINSLCLNFGELYRKASLQTEVSTNRILINLKGHLNALFIANVKDFVNYQG